jgi:hypothetical protein
MTKPRLARTTLVAFLLLVAACSTGQGDPLRQPDQGASPTPSQQPLPGPPVEDAYKMRDALLDIAARSSTTDTADAFGVVKAWKAIFPRMRFGPSEEPATSETISGGDKIFPERADEATATVTFAVLDIHGRCAGGYMSGQGRLARFEPVDPSTNCSGKAVWDAKNPEPEPSPSPTARSTRRSSKSSSGSSGTSEPQTRRGEVTPRPLGRTELPRPISAY